jgi:hypothetical protein
MNHHGEFGEYTNSNGPNPENEQEHFIIGMSLQDLAGMNAGHGDALPLIDSNTGLPFADAKGNPIEGSNIVAAGATQSINTFNSVITNAEDWRSTHGVSMDGLYTPFTTYMETTNVAGAESGDGKVDKPNMEVPYTVTDIEGKTVVKQFYGTGSKTVTSANFNPFAKGHTVSHVVRGNTPNDLSSQGGAPAGHVAELGTPVTGEKEEQRAVGMRGPMVLTGWGYDTDGLPVPNARLEAGNVETNYLSENFGKVKDAPDAFPQSYDEFLPGHMQQLQKWKSGPVDLRWDRDRKVWTSQINKVFLSKTTKCILPQAGVDGLNSFNFGVGGNINIGGRLYRNPCSEQACNWDSYFPTSSLYPDIEIYDPEDQDWCGGCKIQGGTTICDDWSQACVPFYDAVIIRSIEHNVGEQNSYTNCGDKFDRAGPDPMRRRAGNPCHGWGGAYGPKLENINAKIAKDSTFSNRAKSILYQRIFVENPLNQGLMIGDSFISYDTGRRVNYTYVKSTLPTCNTAGEIGDTVPQPMQVTESIPIHVILQAEFVGVEIVTRSGCEQGEVTACSRKIFAQGFSTMEDCGPDDDYPQTATGYF